MVDQTSLPRRLTMHLSHITNCTLVAAIAVCIGLVGAHAVEKDKADSAAPHSRVGASVISESVAPTAGVPGSAKPAERIREGTRLIDEVGTFQNLGDRLAFVPAGNGNKDSYRVLENLALQRIAQSLDGARGQQSWIVSGTFTEFRGANYLLITKASIPADSSAAGGR
jgi:hypothetical protein